MYDSQPATTVVPNRLSSVRELLHEQLRAWLPKFCVAVSNCDDLGSGMPLDSVSNLAQASLRFRCFRPNLDELRRCSAGHFIHRFFRASGRAIVRFRGLSIVKYPKRVMKLPASGCQQVEK